MGFDFALISSCVIWWKTRGKIVIWGKIRGIIVNLEAASAMEFFGNCREATGVIKIMISG